MADDIVTQLRDWACPAGLPHTGNNPRDDHGHTDCWMHHQAADEIERLRAAGDALAYAFRHIGGLDVAYDAPLRAWEEARRV